MALGDAVPRLWTLAWVLVKDCGLHTVFVTDYVRLGSEHNLTGPVPWRLAAICL